MAKTHQEVHLLQSHIMKNSNISKNKILQIYVFYKFSLYLCNTFSSECYSDFSNSYFVIRNQFQLGCLCRYLSERKFVYKEAAIKYSLSTCSVGKFIKNLCNVIHILVKLKSGLRILSKILTILPRTLSRLGSNIWKMFFTVLKVVRDN